MADYFLKVGKPGSATTLSAPGYTTGATTITVGSTANWPTDTKVAFAIDRAEIVAGEEVQIAGTYTEWTGQVTGATTIGSMVLSSDSPNSDQNYAAGSLTRVYIPVSATRENNLIDGILEHANQDGTLITQAVRDALSLGVGSGTGWEVGSLPDVSTVTANGNRSYDITFASAVDSTLSEGMRLEFTKTVAGNGYMGGAFNGSSHYFTKTTPSGTLGTVTNNFTISADVMPTSYAAGVIAGRADATLANGIDIEMNASGQVLAVIRSGGAANVRYATTYQSLPLNKKTRVVATYTSTATTFVVYFDGVSVPFVMATGGTAPTTAGTGGDFSIGRPGANNTLYFPGYISNVTVHDAVLTQATIRQHGTFKNLGSETNCIGAWSLDNTANDQSSAGNNLTATGGVGYTAQSPHGQLGSGVDTTKSVGLVMSVSGSTAVVQVPEGCTIPTSGGVSAVAYSTQSSPYGFVTDKGRWEIVTLNKIACTQASPTTNTWYNLGSTSIYIPIGAWLLNYSVFAQATTTNTGQNGVFSTISTSNNSETDSTTTSSFTQYVSAGNVVGVQNAKFKSIKTAAATTYYLNTKNNQTTTTLYNSGDAAPTVINVIPSCL